MIDKITLLLAKPAKQLIQTLPIVCFLEKLEEKIHVSSRVDKVSTGPLVLWSPHLQSQGLGENLWHKLVLRRGGTGRIFLALVMHLCRLTST